MSQFGGSVDLAHVLVPLLEREGIAMNELAREIHVHPSIVNHWCSGRRPVRCDYLPALARALNTTPRSLTDYGEQLALIGGTPQTPQARLAAVGMVRAPTDPPKCRYELYCILCARGVGPGGTLQDVREVPRWTRPCSYCSGAMFVREVRVSWSPAHALTSVPGWNTSDGDDDEEETRSAA